ncbi:MAG: hypothetical protein C4527_16940 [Candidatus Omnitrophota bacterium]|nr:MAG: hypothetical protein C4527_16940 [Candidatus Omnitrophota bacterium]
MDGATFQGSGFTFRDNFAGDTQGGNSTTYNHDNYHYYGPAFFPQTSCPIAHAILPENGDYSQYGEQVKNGVKLALPYEQNGQISPVSASVPDWLKRGYPVIQFYDNFSNPTFSSTLIQTAAADQTVFAAIGGVVTLNALSLTSESARLSIPLFSPSATAIELAAPERRTYAVSAVPLDNYQVDAIDLFLHEHDYTTIFIITDQSSYGTGFLPLQQKTDLTVAGTYSFDADQSDWFVFAYSQLITAILEKNVEIIVFAGYSTEANLLLKMTSNHSKDRIRNIPWLLTDAATVSNSLSGLDFSNPAYYKPTIFGLTPSIADTLRRSQEFKGLYRQIYGKTPEWFSYYGYDAAWAASEAMFQVNNTVTREGIKNEIPNLRYNGVTGAKWLDDKGMPQSAVYDAKQVINGAFSIVEEIRVKQPGSAYPGGKTAYTRNTNAVTIASDIVFEGFTYHLAGGDSAISHMAGEPGGSGAWIARSRDLDIGSTLVAFYEDAERGLSDEGTEFGFQDGLTYYLTFILDRKTLDGLTPIGDDIVDVKVTAVSVTEDANGNQQFSSEDLTRKTLAFADWSYEGGIQFVIPFVYQSPVASDDSHSRRLNWELKLTNGSRQELTLISVAIGSNEPTGIPNFSLY